MNPPSELTLVDQVVLARLLVAGEKGATTTEIKKALDPLLGHRLAGAALADRLAQALATLDSAGLVHRTRKGKTDRGTRTPAGERRALEFLGIDRLPPGAKWDLIKKAYLAARALGLPTPKDKTVKHVSGDAGFKAALLKTQFDLQLDDYPKFDQALDALAWKLLGFADAAGAKFSVKAVKAALLGRALDGRTQIDPKADFKKEAAKLLAREVGARQSGKDELRIAALRHWIDGASATPSQPSRTLARTHSVRPARPRHLRAAGAGGGPIVSDGPIRR